MEKLISKLSGSFYISEEGARELIGKDIPVEAEITEVQDLPEKAKPWATATSKGLTEEELSEMKSLLITGYGKEITFKNSDLDLVCEVLSLTKRQTPSRLKKLVDEGFLEDLGGSPKVYKVK